MTETSKAMAYEAKKIEEIHEEILGSTLEKGSYTKLYSFKHIINALAVRTTPSQVLLLPTKMKEINLLLPVWFSADRFSGIPESNNDVIYYERITNINGKQNVINI